VHQAGEEFPLSGFFTRQRAMTREEQENLARFIRQVHEIARIFPGGCTIRILPRGSTDHAPDQADEQSHLERATSRSTDLTTH